MMGSAYKLNGRTKLPHPSSQPLPYRRLENPKNPSTSSDTEEKNPRNLKTVQTTRQSEPSDEPLSIDGSQEDTLLINSEFLTQEEVLRRRSRRVKQLGRFYRNQYWALMEEVRLQYREYYWKYGKSPFNEEEGGEEERGVIDGINGSFEVNGDGNRLGLGLGFTEKNNEGKINVNNNNRCVHGGCKAKAMALTNYCHQHILLDSKQKLYKACTYVTKSAQTGIVTCGKPVLRAAVPSLCTVHFQTAQKHVSRALKKAGLNISSSSKPAPKFHVIVTEYVRQIQAKRREARRVANGNQLVKEENHN